jgi:hypothetical protein
MVIHDSRDLHAALFRFDNLSKRSSVREARKLIPEITNAGVYVTFDSVTRILIDQICQKNVK